MTSVAWLSMVSHTSIAPVQTKETASVFSTPVVVGGGFFLRAQHGQKERTNTTWAEREATQVFP